MVDYVKSTNFASKDTLPSGNASKIVKGTEIDTEFNNIAVAIATKADLSAPAFSGSPTAATPTFGDSSTKVATTSFVQSALAAAYPVGSVYINASVATNPATLLGFGTWTAFGAGRVLVGLDSGNSLFDTAEETGGSYDSVAVSHTHTINDPGHTHSGAASSFIPFPYNGTGSQSASVSTTSTGSSTTGISINSSGESGTNKNIQPYITVYMWKRVS